MKRIAWVTDSTASLDQELKEHKDVFKIPMTIIMDDKEYLDGIDLQPEELYAKLKTLKVPPKTSQPSVGAFKELYEKLENSYDVVISILVSSKLSGTVSSSQQAAQMVEIPVITIDSKILSFPLSAQIKRGMKWAEEGLPVDEIREKIEALSNTNNTYVLIGSLEQLHRSGRMSGIQFLLGSMLNIKPIIAVEDGALNIKDKARSLKKAKEKIFQLLKSSYETHSFKEAYLLYGLHDDEAKVWKAELQSVLPNVEFDFYPLGAAIGVHAGENTIGISWYNG